MKQVIILARVEPTGMRLTGKYVRPDGVNWVEEREFCNVARSLVWSRDMKRLEEGKAFADKEGYQLLVMDDTPDVLEKARQRVMLGH